MNLEQVVEAEDLYPERAAAYVESIRRGWPIPYRSALDVCRSAPGPITAPRERRAKRHRVHALLYQVAERDRQ